VAVRAERNLHPFRSADIVNEDARRAHDRCEGQLSVLVLNFADVAKVWVPPLFKLLQADPMS